MRVPQEPMDDRRQQRRSASRDRRSVRDGLEVGPDKNAVAGDRPWQDRDPRRARSLLGRQAPNPMGSSPRSTAKRGPHLCRTRHGEGGQEVFAFPPVAARFVRWTCDDPVQSSGLEIVDINLYGPADAASVRRRDGSRRSGMPRSGSPRARASPSISAMFDPRWARSSNGETTTEPTSRCISPTTEESFREVGRIGTGNGVSDSFWWRSTTSRYFRLTVHEASSPEGAIVNELKLRILNKDRMPIGQLERAALAGRGDLYPQSLSGRQVYWTVLGEFDHAEEALFDEYGNLEPRARLPPDHAAASAGRGLARGACERRDQPIPCRWLASDPERRWSALEVELAERRWLTLAKRWSSTASPTGATSRKRERSFSPSARSRSILTGNTAATPRSTPSPSMAGRSGQRPDLLHVFRRTRHRRRRRLR